MPFRGAKSFLKPLEAWFPDYKAEDQPGHQHEPNFYLSDQAIDQSRQVLKDFAPDVVLVPSAAWEMKRWPLQHWKSLIALLPELRFAVLGGPGDDFCEQLEQSAPERVRNFAGRLSLLESAAIVGQAKLTVSADTGLLHVADQLKKPCLALIGPTAFGYPSNPTSEVIEIELACKPCSKDGRGNCSNELYQRCMIEISPNRVADRIRHHLSQNHA